MGVRVLENADFRYLIGFCDFNSVFDVGLLSVVLVLGLSLGD